MAKEKRKYDWELIEKDVRAGVLSIREISRRHDCPESSIRSKIKTFGWERSLTDLVRKRAQDKLLRKDVRKSNASDEEIIEEKSNEAAGVIQLHRKDIASLRELEAKLIEEISGNPTKLYITQYQGDIIEKEVSLTASERAQAANNLANVQHKRIALERQAFNLDEKTQTYDPLSAILEEAAKRSSSLVREDE